MRVFWIFFADVRHVSNQSKRMVAVVSPTYTARMLAANTPDRKQWAPWWLYVIGVVLGLLVGELGARSSYNVLYGGKQDRLIRAFMGSEGRYNPNMLSNYAPHPYLVYALNPNSRYYEEFYGEKPQH